MLYVSFVEIFVKAHDAFVYALHAFPGGICSGGKDGMVKLWDPRTRREVATLKRAQNLSKLKGYFTSAQHQFRAANWMAAMSASSRAAKNAAGQEIQITATIATARPPPPEKRAAAEAVAKALFLR